MSSEIQRLRQQIEDETLAMQQAMNGYSAVARHDIVRNRYQALDDARNELSAIVGPDEAMSIVFEAYSNVMDGEVKP